MAVRGAPGHARSCAERKGKRPEGSGLLLFLIATLSFEDEMIPVRHLGGHSPGFFRFKQESVLSDNIQQLPQVPDLIVDPQVLWPGLSSRIVPAAGKSGIVGALDVCGEGVSDHETVLRRQAGYAGADIGIISRVRLGGSGVLGNKGVRDESCEHTALQAAALDGGHSVGDDVQLVPPADQFPACLLYTSPSPRD